ncbi:hypothetical protein Agau_C200327 [Agrobacterium tumefaciens F2]|nr:hypothetical protein Agau_C200327 [Agrobacterium tumefaciens F2]
MGCESSRCGRRGCRHGRLRHLCRLLHLGADGRCCGDFRGWRQGHTAALDGDGGRKRCRLRSGGGVCRRCGRRYACCGVSRCRLCRCLRRSGSGVDCRNFRAVRPFLGGIFDTCASSQCQCEAHGGRQKNCTSSAEFARISHVAAFVMPVSRYPRVKRSRQCPVEPSLTYCKDSGKPGRGSPAFRRFFRPRCAYSRR